MLRSTFIHAAGVGDQIERWLWQTGITDWAAFRARPRVAGLGPTIRGRIGEAVDRGEEALASGDAGHFQRCLPAREAWRIFGEFQGSVRYLDIETAGLSWQSDPITVIGISDGHTARAWVAGRDLARFEEALAGAAVLVTFNGKAFDVPFIKHQFPGVALPPAHIDLRHVLRALGLSGGLKKIEREVGMDRKELSGVDGAFAVALWRRHLAGDRRAMSALIRYNLEDVVNLRYLMEWAYNRAIAARGAPGAPLALTPPDPPAIDFDPEILREIAFEIRSGL